MSLAIRAGGAAVLGVAASVLVLLEASSGSQLTTPAGYPSCGTYWNRNSPATMAMERRVNTCIVKAAKKGRRARAVAVLTTIEGDPIANYLFVRGAHDVLVVVDSTRDAFGARIWHRFQCTTLVLIDGRLGWTRCRTIGSGKPRWLKPIRLPR